MEKTKIKPRRKAKTPRIDYKAMSVKLKKQLELHTSDSISISFNQMEHIKLKEIVGNKIVELEDAFKYTEYDDKITSNPLTQFIKESKSILFQIYEKINF